MHIYTYTYTQIHTHTHTHTYEPLTGNYLLSDYVTFSLIWWVSLEVASVDKVLDPVE